MKNKFVKQLSVIVPTFNEKDNIGELIERISNSLVLNGFFYEILVIDDGSTDGTEEIVQRLSSMYPVSFFSKRGKKGKAYSLFEGFAKAIYQNLAFIDADLQYPPEEIVKMALKLKNFDVVVADRKTYQDSLSRRVFSKTFKKVFGKFLFDLDYDVQSGLKVFRKEVIDVVNFQPSSSWTFDLEFLRNAREAGFMLGNHSIVFSKRTKGDSKIGLIKTAFEIGANAIELKLSPMLPRQVSPNFPSMKGAGVRYKKKSYTTHTTLPYTKSSLITFSDYQKFIIAVFMELIIMGAILNPLLTLGVIVCLLSSVYFIDTLFTLFIVSKSLIRDQEIKVSDEKIDELSDSNLPIYTILCPLYKEAHIIPQFLENISKVSWPKNKLDVILLLEEDDNESIIKAKELNLPSHMRTLVVPKAQPKTKPKACNYGLSHAKGDYLVIFDAEDKPDPLQLKKAFIAFKEVGRDVVCLQAKLNYYNSKQNLLTRFFTAEYSLWFDVALTGFQSIKTSIPLGGTSNHFRTKDLLTLQGWDPFNVTEDADLGMRLFKAGYKTAIIDSTTYEEANSKWGNWVRQRSRWIKGYMQTYLVHTRDSWGFLKENPVHFALFHLIIGGKISFILINPLLWIATISYFALYQYVGPAIEKLYPSIIFYMAAFSLVFGNFLFMYYYMIGVMKREQYSVVKYVFLIPFYWLMISVAGFMALYQLFFKPFYWEKTTHGLHLLKKRTATQPKKKGFMLPGIGLPRPTVSFNSTFSSLKKGILLPLKFAMSLFI